MKTTPTLLPLLLLVALSASPGRAQTDEPTPPPPPAVEEVPVEAPESPPAPAPEARKERVRDFTAGFSAGASGSGEVVRIGGDVLVAAGEKTKGVVAIMDSIVADGEIDGEAVAVLGDVTINGSADGDVVAVLGSVTINGFVDGEVVAVLGSVQLGPEARVKGDIVAVGGRLIRAPGAQIDGSVQQLPFFSGGVPNFTGLRVWVRECLMYGRPLAFHADLVWAWGLADVFFAVYLLLALIFGRPMVKCAEVLEQRPVYTILTAVLVFLLTPVLIVLLAFTGIGPFLLMPLLFLAGFFGKAAFLVWLGRRVMVPLGVNLPIAAALVGSVLLLSMYVVPVLGFFMQQLSMHLGLGMAVLAVIQGFRREPAPAAPASPGAGGVPPPAPAPVPAPAAPVAGSPEAMAAASGFVATETSGESANTFTPPPGPPAPPPPPAWTSPADDRPFTTLPRAGFWLRTGALALDAILVGFVIKLLSGGAFPVWFAGYCVVLWVLRGTTVGGAVCGLKVVRLDDRPVDWAVALVRALGGFLSLAALGLGFFWIAFDRERQSWHDKIAGTVVVRVPKGVSLL